MLVNTPVANSVIALSNQGPNIINDSNTAIILGTKANVASWIWVTAWKILTKRPTTKLNPNIGAATTKIVLIASWASLRTSPWFIISPHYLKPRINDFDIKFQPSTNINNSILKGKEIITGGNIIIPIDINVLDTTISITRNGI